MGSILAETPKGPKIEHLILPVKDLFSAVFFVSVGMLINPKILLEYFWVILLITVITIVSKFVSTAIGSLISGRSFRSSVQTGMSLAQIGEFSFIIATLGMNLKVTSDFLYPIAVAVSAVTTFTTPYLIKYSDRFAHWLEGHLPAGLKESLSRYETVMSTTADASILSLVWKEYGVKIVLNSVIVIAITSATNHLALPYLGDGFRNRPMNFVACAIALTLSGPFLWAIFFGGPSHSTTYKAETAEQLRRLQLGIAISRFIIGCGLAGFVVSNFTSMLAFSGILLIATTALGAFFFSRFSKPIYTRIENRFISNLTANERAAIEKKAKVPELAPWSATLAEFQISSSSPLITKTLKESGIKEQFGVTVAMIERGDSRILAPKRGDVLLPCDKVFLIGTDEQLGAVREIIEKKPTTELPSIDGNFGLASLILTPHDKFVNRPIRECGIREAVNGLIVGIERDGQRHLSPDSSMKLLAGDLVWLVGDKSLIRGLRTPMQL
jgi:CPA2 family monovalent cation:H+ antiporter-2